MRLVACLILIGGAALPAPAMADWRELRLNATMLGGTLEAAHIDAGSRRPRGLAGGLGMDASYGLSDRFEVGIALRGHETSALRWTGATLTSNVGDGRTFTVDITATSRVLFMAASVRFNVVTDNRLAVYLAAQGGAWSQGLIDAELVDQGGQRLLPLRDDRAVAAGAGGAAGIDVRLATTFVVGARVEGATAVGPKRPTRLLSAGLALGYQFYLL